MRKNTLFNFIHSGSIATINKDKENRDFALFPLDRKAVPAPFHLQEHHFTVYAGDDEAHDSEFHYTANMRDESGDRIKVHVFFNRHNVQTGSVTFLKRTASDFVKMEMDDEAIHVFFNQMASAMMKTTILPIKLKLDEKVRGLDVTCTFMLKTLEGQSEDKAKYLTGLQKIKPIFEQLIQLVPNDHKHVGNYKLISNIIKKLQAENEAAEACDDPEDSPPPSPVEEQSKLSKVNSNSTSRMTRALKRAEIEQANAEIKRFVDKTLHLLDSAQKIATEEEDVTLINRPLLSETVDLTLERLAEANGFFLTLDEHLTLANLFNLHVAYNNLLMLGANLFRLAIRIPATDCAKKMPAFYDLIGLEDLSRAIEGNHQFLIEYFIKDCHLPIEHWEVNIRGKLYPSVLHYLISEPDDNKADLLILLISNGISILSNDPRIACTLLISDNRYLQRVMADLGVKSLTTSHRGFCKRLTALLEPESSLPITAVERQKILSTLTVREKQPPAKLVALQAEIFSMGRSYQESLKMLVTPTYEAAYESEPVKNLRATTFQQIKHLIPRISSPGKKYDEKEEFQVICDIRTMILYPPSEGRDIYKCDHLVENSSKFNMSESYPFELGALSALNDVRLIQDKLVTAYKYLSAVLAFYHGICTARHKVEQRKEGIDDLCKRSQMTKKESKRQKNVYDDYLTDVIEKTHKEIMDLITNRKRELLELKKQHACSAEGASAEKEETTVLRSNGLC